MVARAAGGPQGKGARRGRRGAALWCQHSAAATLPTGGQKRCARPHREREEPRGAETPSMGLALPKGPKPWLPDPSPTLLRPSCLPPARQKPWVRVVPSLPGRAGTPLPVWELGERSLTPAKKLGRQSQARRSSGQDCRALPSGSLLLSHGSTRVPIPARASAG